MGLSAGAARPKEYFGFSHMESWLVGFSNSNHCAFVAHPYLFVAASPSAAAAAGVQVCYLWVPTADAAMTGIALIFLILALVAIFSGLYFAAWCTCSVQRSRKEGQYILDSEDIDEEAAAYKNKQLYSGLGVLLHALELIRTSIILGLFCIMLIALSNHRVQFLITPFCQIWSMRRKSPTLRTSWTWTPSTRTSP